MRSLSIRTAIFMLIINCLSAQQTGEFVLLANVLHDGIARKVVYRDDGMVFLANGQDGLRAFSYQDSHFVSIAHYREESETAIAADVALGADGTIFLANFQDGLRAYTFDGVSFVNTAHVNQGGEAVSVAVGDGNMVFLADQNLGLNVYSYDGVSFTLVTSYGLSSAVVEVSGSTIITQSELGLTALTFDGSSLTLIDTAIIESRVADIAFGSNDVFYVANDRAGVKSYTIQADSLAIVLSIIPAAEGEYDDIRCNSVTVGADGTVFVAINEGGVCAYQLMDSNLVEVDRINEEWSEIGGTLGLCVGPDGILMVARAWDGLFAYGYHDNTFDKIASINEGGYVYFGNNAPGEVVAHPGGKIATVNGYDGVRVYNFVYDDFRNITHLHTWDANQYVASDVLIGAGEAIFVTAYDGYLRAYEMIHNQYTETAVVYTGGLSNIPLFRRLTQLNDGTILVAGENPNIHAYAYNGVSFSLISTVSTSAAPLGIAVDSEGNIFVADADQGVKVFSFDGSSFTLIASNDEGGQATNISVSNDGLVVAPNFQGGLKLYQFDGSALSYLLDWEASRPVVDALVGSDGVIYVGYADINGEDGGEIEALSYSNNTITKLAGDTLSTPFYSLALGNGDTLYTANGTRGMFAWKFINPSQFESQQPNLPEVFVLSQNYPNPFNPSTTIRYGLPEDVNISLVIYDVRGQVVQTIESEHQSAGWYDVVWSGQSADGKNIEAGIYYARLVAGDYGKTIKMLMIK